MEKTLRSLLKTGIKYHGKEKGCLMLLCWAIRQNNMKKARLIVNWMDNDKLPI